MSFKILSLDGGGARGYLSAKILANIESHLNIKNNEEIPIGQRFDFIAGTSTGGIIALALALGKTAKDVEKLYYKNIPEIFGRKQRFCLKAISPKYKSFALEKMVEEVFDDYSLNDVKTHVLITSVNLDNAKPRFHKSGYFQRNSERLNEKLKDIAIATSAAPTYFKAKADLKHSHNLIDGGICANNPSLSALIDSLNFQSNSLLNTIPPKNIQDIVLISVGTGEIGEMPYNSSKLANGGWSDWAIPIIDILMESQSQLAHFQTKFLLKENYLRINPKLPFKMKLDDIKKLDNLKNLASLDADTDSFLNLYF
ncbi:MAG: CBASS cGAMP-activated phospholipase [Methylococcaceae bacterium]